MVIYGGQRKFSEQALDGVGFRVDVDVEESRARGQTGNSGPGEIARTDYNVRTDPGNKRARAIMLTQRTALHGTNKWVQESSTNTEGMYKHAN